MPRGAVPGRPAYGGVAAARHPRPGGYSHRGYYPRHHHGGYYRPYYYPYYGYPYASFSFGWGWPYSYWGWPYGYGPSYSVAYHAYPGRGWDTPAREADRSDTDAAYAEPRPLDPSRAEGRIRLEVRPEDASVYVDDEFRGAGRETKFLNLAAGRHTIELVRPGFDVVRRDVDVTRGETTDVLVEMTRR